MGLSRTMGPGWELSAEGTTLEGKKFEALAKQFAADGTRRTLLGRMAGLAAGVVGVGVVATRAEASVGEEECVPNGRKCGRAPNVPNCNKCCSRTSIRTASGARRCKCTPWGGACTNDAQCCGGVCRRHDGNLVCRLP